MSEPAIFALIRDGKKQYYGDRWASVFLFRELVWGPEDFEKWVSQLEPLDEWTDDASGGAVVDFDQRLLTWNGDSECLQIPKVAALYDRLLQAAWPRYTIRCEPFNLNAMIDPAFAERDGNQPAHVEYETVEDARILPSAQLEDAYESDEGDEEGEGDAEYEDDENDEEDEMGGESRAWITVIDSAGAIHHREVYSLPKEVLTNQPGAIANLIQLQPAEVPPEAEVLEGMWIDQPRKAVAIWGGAYTRERLRLAQQSWVGWNVRWAERGYAEQCHVSGPGGTPLTETDALAKFLPIVLSTKRFDVSTVFGFLGGKLKRTAMKATGCLTIAMCMPVLLFGLVSGNWRGALITCAVVCVVVVVLFKLVEIGFRRSMNAKMKPLTQRGQTGEQRAAVAGPLDKQERRQRIDQLLLAAGFPPLKIIEPSFAKDESLGLLE